MVRDFEYLRYEIKRANILPGHVLLNSLVWSDSGYLAPVEEFKKLK